MKMTQTYKMSPIVSALMELGVKDMNQNPMIQQIPIAGRASLFTGNWKARSSDQWILKCIMGYEIQWQEMLYQNNTPREIVIKEEKKGIYLRK